MSKGVEDVKEVVGTLANLCKIRLKDIQQSASEDTRKESSGKRKTCVCGPKSTGSLVHSRESKKKRRRMKQSQMGKPGKTYVKWDPSQLCKIKRWIN